MELSIWTEERRRKTVRTGIWALVGIVLFHAAVCTPVYQWSVSDVVIADTAFPAIWDAVQWIVLYLFYWVAFAFAIYLATRYTLKRCISYFICYAVCVVVRYIATLGIASFMMPGDAGDGSVWTNILEMLLIILLDYVQMALVALFIYLFLERKRTSDSTKWLFFPKLFGLSNPILRCILLAVSVSAVFKLLSRVRYDVFYGGAQNLFDFLFIIFSYVMDVVSILIGYMVVFLLISRLNLKDEEARAHVVEQIPGGDF